MEHVRLPMHVTDAQDVRRVSVLKATGLIEATIDPAFDPGGNYRLAQAALIVCITDEGHGEIQKLRGGSVADTHAQAQPTQGLDPLDYLRGIKGATFPLRVEDHEEINCVEALKQAGYVDASISAALIWKGSGTPQELAIVRRITPLGRAQLVRAQLVQGKRPAD
ncbi:hypothetical protein [Variovorax sp. H27-G14]|uniref:hypothetical protein n=1 Tax=Variovorax sp. H27-G14 TaxID=3111914 RepID=UPI0038FD13FC